jgi:uncharacterized membrane protein
VELPVMRGALAWNRRYSLVSYLRSALWVAPVVALVAALVLKRVSEWAGGWMERRGLLDPRAGFYGLDAAEAHAMLDRLFSLNVGCLVFAFGSLLVAIQVAGGQYTPRVIATTLLRDRVIRGIVGLFVFTLLWANRTMVQIGQEARVPQMQVFLAAVFGLAALVAFIVLIDYAARLLRPVSLVRRIGQQGLAVIDSVYPAPLLDEPEHLAAGGTWRWDAASRVVFQEDRSAIVLAVNAPALVAEARRADCVIEFAAQVGDFLGMGEPLFYLYGEADTLDERRLRTLVALGSERTMEQDPMFAFRIEVDIALKALSAAINDPTTAVLAIDQLQRLLGKVGKRALRGDEIRDGAGRTRVILRTPNWEDYVHISFREIRHYGAGSLQVERRLRAMIEHLLATLPAHRHGELRIELELLDLATRQHVFRQDTALAQIPDSQGLGGAAGAAAAQQYGHQAASDTRH